jgi:hypothetical protein
VAARSAAEGEAAETVGKRTYAALTAALRLTAAVPGTGAGRRLIATERTRCRGRGASLEVVAFSVASVRV